MNKVLKIPTMPIINDLRYVLKKSGFTVGKTGNTLFVRQNKSSFNSVSYQFAPDKDFPNVYLSVNVVENSESKQIKIYHAGNRNRLYRAIKYFTGLDVYPLPVDAKDLRP